MKLISTSKMQKAIARYDANLLYFNRVRSAIKDILVHSMTYTIRFWKSMRRGIRAYIVIAADKGLCGAYNHNILNFASEFMTPDEKIRHNDRAGGARIF